MKVKFTDTEKFCIKHQKMDPICILDDGSVGHLAALFAPDWGWCEGPFASCPPPALPEDWNMHVTEPSPSELMVMDIHAEEILAEM
jgi:hypothetical protein